MIINPAGGWITFSIFATLTIATLIYSIIRRPRHGVVNKLTIITRSIAVLLILMAVARPSVPTYAEIERLGSDLDIYFVLDTTASMGAQDVSGEERLAYAKEQILDIADSNVGAKYSLITFDSTSRVDIPLIRDISSLKSTLAMVRPQVYVPGLSKGTNTKLAADLLTKTLSTNAEQNPERVRVVYYITDGENTDYQENAKFTLEGAGQLADESYVIGVGGTEPAEIPRYVFDDALNVVQDGVYDGGASAVSAEQIQAIADELGAEPILISNASESFPAVKAEPKEQKLTLVDKRSPAQMEFYWILAVGGILMLSVDTFFLTRKTYEAAKRS